MKTPFLLFFMNSIWFCILNAVDNMKDIHSVALVCRASARAAKITREQIASRFQNLEPTACGWQEFLPTPAHRLHGSFGYVMNDAGHCRVSFFQFGERDKNRKDFVLKPHNEENEVQSGLSSKILMIARRISILRKC